MAKRHLGMAAYYAKATHLWLTHRMERFVIDFEGEAPRSEEVSQLLAVRIRHFGGVLRELAPGASLDRDDLRLVLFRTRSRAAYLGYVLRGLMGAKWQIPGIELVHASLVNASVGKCLVPHFRRGRWGIAGDVAGGDQRGGGCAHDPGAGR